MRAAAKKILGLMTKSPWITHTIASSTALQIHPFIVTIMSHKMLKSLAAETAA
jgi:hypothetical protein